MRLLHRVAVQERAVAADAIETVDLGVNPMSMILIAIKPLNETSTLGNYANWLSICEAFNRVTVMHRGSAIFNMSGIDAAVLALQRYHWDPMEANSADTDNERRCCVLPIILGRFPYDPRSCIPETIRGELTLELDIDVADTGYDTFRYSVETVELLGARPSEFERKISINQTIASTGVNDIRLPIGHQYRGLQIWSSVAATGAAPAPVVGRARLMADGTEVAYTSTDFEVLKAISNAMGGSQTLFHHTHRVDATAASATQQTTAPQNYSGGNLRNYVFMDLDPTRDDTYSLDTRALADWILQFDAESTGSVRVVGIERVTLGDAA